MQRGRLSERIFHEGGTGFFVIETDPEVRGEQQSMTRKEPAELLAFVGIIGGKNDFHADTIAEIPPAGQPNSPVRERNASGNDSSNRPNLSADRAGARFPGASEFSALALFLGSSSRTAGVPAPAFS